AGKHSTRRFERARGIGEGAQNIIAARADKPPAFLVGNRPQAIETLADLEHRGGIADPLIKRRAAADIRQQDRNFDRFLRHGPSLSRRERRWTTLYHFRLDADISARCVTIRADDVAFLDKVLGLRPVETGKAHFELDRQAEAFLVVALADADMGRDLGIVADLDHLLARREFDGAEITGGIAGSEQLFRIDAGSRAAKLLGRRQIDVDLAVIGAAVTLAPTGRGRMRGIGNLHFGLHDWGSAAPYVLFRLAIATPRAAIAMPAQASSGIASPRTTRSA